MKKTGIEKYNYNNCPIPGGGYVTGFVYHPVDKDVLYCRTDIGGTYRYNAANDNWISLIDHVTMENPAETFPIAVALDPRDSDYLYIACGVNEVPRGTLAVSHDRGESFLYHELPVMVHGNLNGRGTGERLCVDVIDSNTLYFASQQEGLWRSFDKGANWEKMSAFPEEYMCFVGQSADGRIMVAAGAGVTSRRSESLRGHSLYVSFDMGEHFLAVPGPEDTDIDGVRLAGHIAQRFCFDENYLYVTYSVMGRNAYVFENGYSCDGGSVIGGRVYRYDLDMLMCLSATSIEDENFALGVDITPEEYPSDTRIDKNLLEYGFSGIATTPNMEGLLIVSTICKNDGDCFYRSYDHGESWQCVMHGLECGRMEFRASYMKPEFNGGGNLIHWMTSLAIDPYDKNRAWFNTGTGVFRTDNLCDDTVVFSDRCDGIEETVHLNLYSPPSGDVTLIDILGDLGGFAFKDVSKQCDNSFADADGNRYITCINADYSDLDPQVVVVTPRGNWTGKTKGGLIISHDQCKTFDRLDLPYGLSEELDKAFEMIETPNVNSGWVALSADTHTIVWSVADGITLPVSRVIVSHDEGKTFGITKIYEMSGQKKTSGCFKVFSDRTKPEIFYGFDEAGKVYVSLDCGDTFRELEVEGNLPTVDFGLIDTRNKTEIRVESGKSGILIMALGDHGLWKLIIDDKKARAYTLSGEKTSVYRVGLGIGKPGADYMSDEKAIYFAGSVDGEYGFYRFYESSGECIRLNNNNQMFGDINSIEADARIYGRFYIATGSRGVLFADPA